MKKNIYIAETTGIDRRGAQTGDIFQIIATFDRDEAIEAAIADWDHQGRDLRGAKTWVDAYAAELAEGDDATAEQIWNAAVMEDAAWTLNPVDSIDISAMIADRDREYRVKEAFEDLEPWIDLRNPDRLNIADLRTIAEDAGLALDALMAQVEPC